MKFHDTTGNVPRISLLLHVCTYLKFHIKWINAQHKEKRMRCIKGNTIVGHILKGFEMTYMQFPLLHDVHWVVGFTLNEVFFFSVLCGKAEKRQNTVFGYKKLSKSDSDEIFKSATPKFHVFHFLIFLSNRFFSW